MTLDKHHLHNIGAMYFGKFGQIIFKINSLIQSLHYQRTSRMPFLFYITCEERECDQHTVASLFLRDKEIFMLCETSLTLTTLISYQSWAGGTDKIKMNVASITLKKYLKKISQKFCNAREKFLTNS